MNIIIRSYVVHSGEKILCKRGTVYNKNNNHLQCNSLNRGLNSWQQLHSYHCDTNRDLQITLAVMCGFAPCFMICRWINTLQNYGSLTDRVLICSLSCFVITELSCHQQLLCCFFVHSELLVWLLLWYWWAFSLLQMLSLKKSNCHPFMSEIVSLTDKSKSVMDCNNCTSPTATGVFIHSLK